MINLKEAKQTQKDKQRMLLLICGCLLQIFRYIWEYIAIEPFGGYKKHPKFFILCCRWTQGLVVTKYGRFRLRNQNYYVVIN